MKLYATITSERARKGQGGNEYLNIVVLDSEKTEIWRFIVSPGDKPYAALYEAGNGVHVWAAHAKGNKQKGEEDKRYVNNRYKNPFVI